MSACKARCVIVGACLVTFGGISFPGDCVAGKKDVPSLIGVLQSGSSDERQLAAFRLSKMGAAARPAVPALIDSLDALFPSESIRALKGVGVGSIPQVIEGLKRDDGMIRLNLIRVLGELGPEAGSAVPGLVEILKSVERIEKPETLIVPWTRDAILLVLPRLGPEAQKAIPSLFSVLDNAEDENVRVAAIRALGRIGGGDEATVSTLVKRLQSSSSPVSRMAYAEALGESRVLRGEVIVALVKSTEDEGVAVKEERGARWGANEVRLATRTVRGAAVAALGGLMNDALARRNLIALLRHPDDEVSGGALRVLRPDEVPYRRRRLRVSIEEIDQLRTILNSNDSRAAARAARVLSSSPDGVSVILACAERLLATPSKESQQRGLQLLWIVPRPEKGAVSILKNVFHARDLEVRAALGMWLARNEPTETMAIPTLVEALPSNDKKAARHAAYAFSFLGKHGASAIPEIVAALGTNVGDASLLNALGKMESLPERFLPNLIPFLEDRSQLLRDKAARALGRIRVPDKILPLLLRLIGDPDGQVQNAAVDAIGGFGPDAKVAARPLVSLAMRQAWGRDKVLRALKRIDPQTEFVTDILAVLKSTDAARRLEALGVLRELGPVARFALPALTHAVKDGDPMVRVSAASAIGAIGGSAEAVEATLDSLQIAPIGHRASFLAALGRLGPMAATQAVSPILALMDEDLGADEMPHGEGARWRIEAAIALARMAEPAIVRDVAVPILMAAVEDGDGGAAEALGDLGASAAAAVPVLRKALQRDFEEPFRLEAAIALSKIDPGIHDGVEDLERGLDWFYALPTGRACRDALVRIGTPEARAAVAEFESAARAIEDSDL